VLATFDVPSGYDSDEAMEALTARGAVKSAMYFYLLLYGTTDLMLQHTPLNDIDPFEDEGRCTALLGAEKSRALQDFVRRGGSARDYPYDSFSFNLGEDIVRRIEDNKDAPWRRKLASLWSHGGHDVESVVKQYTVVCMDGMQLRQAQYKSNTAIAMAAVMQNGHALQYAALALKYNPQDAKAIAMAAVEQNGLALEHVPPLLKRDADVVAAAVAKDPFALKHAPPEALTTDVVRSAKNQNPNALDVLPKGWTVKQNVTKELVNKLMGDLTIEDQNQLKRGGSSADGMNKRTGSSDTERMPPAGNASMDVEGEAEDSTPSPPHPPTQGDDAFVLPKLNDRITIGKQSAQVFVVIAEPTAVAKEHKVRNEHNGKEFDQLLRARNATDGKCKKGAGSDWNPAPPVDISQGSESDSAMSCEEGEKGEGAGQSNSLGERQCTPSDRATLKDLMSRDPHGGGRGSKRDRNKPKESRPTASSESPKGDNSAMVVSSPSPLVASHTNSSSSSVRSLPDIDRKHKALASMKKADVDAILAMRAVVTDVTWDDVLGVDDIQKRLDESVVMPLQRPDLFVGLTSAKKGMLLFGPPGTGKTMIAKAVAAQVGFHFFNVQCSDIESKWRGESYKLIDALFAVARAARPGSIIFLDECDSLLRKPGGGDDASQDAKIVNSFKASWDGVVDTSTNEGSNVFVIGATNKPQDLDSAIIRPGRMDFRVLVSLPNREGRLRLLQRKMTKDGRQYDAAAEQKVLDHTDGYSGADMEAVCKEAAMGPVRDILRLPMGTPLRSISVADFERAWRSVPRSADDVEVQALHDWNERIGTK